MYEGSYWDLLRDCNELVEYLRAMCAAPSLLEEPKLCLPGGPNLPAWDDFEPKLVEVGGQPQVPCGGNCWGLVLVPVCVRVRLTYGFWGDVRWRNGPAVAGAVWL